MNKTYPARLTHLHPSMEEPRGKYRRCDRAVLMDQIGTATVHRLNGVGIHRRIVEAEPIGDSLLFDIFTVGVLIPLGGRRAVRVLYNWQDLYNAELIKYDDTSFEVLKQYTDLYAENLAEWVEDLAADAGQ